LGSRILLAAPSSSTSFFRSVSLFDRPVCAGRAGGESRALSAMRAPETTEPCGERNDFPLPKLTLGPATRERVLYVIASLLAAPARLRFRASCVQPLARWDVSCSVAGGSSSFSSKIFSSPFQQLERKQLNSPLRGEPRSFSTCERTSAVVQIDQLFRMVAHRKLWGELETPQTVPSC